MELMLVRSIENVLFATKPDADLADIVSWAVFTDGNSFKVTKPLIVQKFKSVFKNVFIKII